MGTVLGVATLIVRRRVSLCEGEREFIYNALADAPGQMHCSYRNRNFLEVVTPTQLVLVSFAKPSLCKESSDPHRADLTSSKGDTSMLAHLCPRYPISGELIDHRAAAPMGTGTFSCWYALCTNKVPQTQLL